jgi:hypothetical protein
MIEEVADLAKMSVWALGDKLRDEEAKKKAGLGELAGVTEKMVKLHQLLTGGATDTVQVMSSGIAKRIIDSSELYD